MSDHSTGICIMSPVSSFIGGPFVVSLNKEEADPEAGKLDHRTSYCSFSCCGTSDKAPLFYVFYVFFFNSLAI